MNVYELKDEWNQYCLEDIKEVLYQSNNDKPPRIDYYWSIIELIKNDVGHTKYPTIFSVVKALLTLVHGNVLVERKFPDSGKTVTL